MSSSYILEERKMRCEKCGEKYGGKTLKEMLYIYKEKIKGNAKHDEIATKLKEFRKQFRYRKNYPFGKPKKRSRFIEKLSKSNKLKKQKHKKAEYTLIHKPKYCMHGGGMMR